MSGDVEHSTYMHDCLRCVFLGTVAGPNPDWGERKQAWDLYFCPTNSLSVIARFGSGGPQYMSVPRWLAERGDSGTVLHPALLWALALVRAKEQKGG